MTHDMSKDNEIMNHDEQPLELSAELRREVSVLFAPMDCSIASSVTAMIGSRRSRRRLLQSLWLGFSPVVAVAFVAVLYVGGAVLPRRMSFATSKGAFMPPNTEIRVQDDALGGLVGSENASGLAVACRAPSFRILLEGNVARRQLLATWMKTRHADVALELESAALGSQVALTLEPDEVRGFSALMALHGFTGQEPSGLRTVNRCAPASWASSLGASSLSICIVP
jgi:hypothetical protein